MLAEDHHPEGGLGSAVVDALTGGGRAELAVAHLAVREMPGSGTSEELLDAAGIDAGSHRGGRPPPARLATMIMASFGQIAPVSGHDHERSQLLPVRPQRRRMARSAMLNRLCTRMPRIRITMMIAVALGMSD